ncbi:acyltransferase [Bacillus sp. ISL-7]|uniref:acyltransferase n=1 Tax=Bacillus sp. ISL-7 TaxID=2819136 RepID=UPI001BECA336|nr:acyltransferase [Bacillus sp. ISL-7]MBT2738386.1 acyltransferase [Bacillus sp. ISL-7]
MNLLFLLKDKSPFTSGKKRAEMYRDKLAKMGNNCEVFYKVSFGSEPYLIELGDNVRITQGVKFITHDGGIYVLRNLGLCNPNGAIYGKIKVGSNTFIGNDVIILPGVEIGENCVIGAGSVVSRSIPAYSVAVGTPAKVVRIINEYYEKNKELIIDTLNITNENKKSTLINLDENKFVKK